MRNRWVTIVFTLALFLFASHASAQEADYFELPVEDQELSISRYIAEGEHLIIWIAPGYGTQQRAFDISKQLTKHGVEVWHVDLADSLFLTKNTSTMRSLDGRYVAGLIEAAHERTGKRITLLTRSYGAIPLLRGARLWQQRHMKDKAEYLNGAILFSPELYSTVPSLGLDPIYTPITYATNIPIVIYQADKRGNRWQLASLLENLQQGGATVYTRIKRGIVGMMYLKDNSAIMQSVLKALPQEITTDLALLKRYPLAKTVVALPQLKQQDSHGLDSTLKVFMGNPDPPALDLISIYGERIKRDHYRGKVTVVNFWASWCPPCVEEIPSLNNLREAMQGKPFELISVNYAESKQVVDDFLKLVKVDFPVLLDEDGKVAASWNVLVFPSTFVIGPDGKIKSGVNGGIAWDSPEVIKALEGMLKE